MSRGADCPLHSVVIDQFRNTRLPARRKRINWNPVCALNEQVLTVNPETEALPNSGGIILLLQLDRTDSDPLPNLTQRSLLPADSVEPERQGIHPGFRL